MVNFFSRKLALVGLALGLAGFAAAPASATYADVTADAGTYSPVSLGSNITLDACGSTFAGYSICDLPSTTKFTIEWFILRKEDAGWDNWLKQYTYAGSSVDPNLQKTISTGEGSVINTAGTYFIGLHVVSYYDWIQLPSGAYKYGGDSDWSWSGTFTVAEGSVTPPSPTNPPSSVPEPLAALLLLPGIALIARRERRRRRHAAVAA